MDMDTIMKIVGRITLDYNLQLQSMGTQIEELKQQLADACKPKKEKK